MLCMRELYLTSYNRVTKGPEYLFKLPWIGRSGLDLDPKNALKFSIYSYLFMFKLKLLYSVI